MKEEQAMVEGQDLTATKDEGVYLPSSTSTAAAQLGLDDSCSEQLMDNLSLKCLRLLVSTLKLNSTLCIIAYQW